MQKTISRLAALTAASFAMATIASSLVLTATAHAATGNVALYRLYSQRYADHFYTTNPAERDNAIQRFGYSNEGVAGFVGAQNVAGSTPLYRQYSKGAGDHFYTTNAAERDNATRIASHYSNEGAMGFLFNAPNVVAVAPAAAPAPVTVAQTPPAPAPVPVPAPVPAPAPTPAPITGGVNFDKARISLTFDDGWKSIHDNGLPALTAHNMKSTQFLNSQPIDGQFSDYMSYQDVADFYKAGHELGWHTQTHADLATLTPVQLDTELTLPSTFIAGLNAVGVPVTLPNFANFATPYGSYNADTWSQNAGTAVSPEAAADPNYVITKIMTKYGSHRSTDVGYNIKATFKASNIVVQNVDATTTPATVQTWITQAKTDNAWLVLVFHEVYNTPDTSSPAKDRTYDVTTANLNAELDEIQTSGISVETVAQALAEIRAQI